jgi:low affinity Fe/Cu permease
LTGHYDNLIVSSEFARNSTVGIEHLQRSENYSIYLALIQHGKKPSAVSRQLSAVSQNKET